MSLKYMWFSRSQAAGLSKGSNISIDMRSSCAADLIFFFLIVFFQDLTIYSSTSASLTLKRRHPKTTPSEYTSIFESYFLQFLV